VVAAADVGGIKKKFGWAIRDYASCIVRSDIDEFGKELVNRLDAGARVALGFEAQLYVPLPKEARQIGRSRKGEFVSVTGKEGAIETKFRPF
jgi:hypothetical protein